MVGLKTPKIFFTADLHLGHKNILTLAGRRFDSIEEHDMAIYEAINDTVSTADHLYVLGDIGFHKDLNGLRSALLKINCRNIHVIKGNHDNLQHLAKLKQENVIADVKEMQTVQYDDKSIFCCHYPLREWPGFWRGHYAAYGHVHATLPSYEKSMDVGIDSIGLNPVEFNELIEKIDKNKTETRISKEDEMINEFFPDLSVHYFVGLCTGNEEIRNKITEVLLREFNSRGD